MAAILRAMGARAGGTNRWMPVLSLAVIAAVHIAAGVALYEILSNRMASRAAAAAQEFLESVVRSEQTAAAAFSAKSPTPALQAFARHIESLPGTRRVTIYSLDGYIRYSTEANLTGIRFDDNDELDRALKGEVIVERVDSAIEKEEQLGLMHHSDQSLMEVYVPVRDPSGAPLGVVEFYQDMTGLEAAFAELRTTLAAILGLSALVLGAAYVSARRRAR